MISPTTDSLSHETLAPPFYILDGGTQPDFITKVFVTPDGFFPRMADFTNLYGRPAREVIDRRIKNPRPRFRGYYRIDQPTRLDVQKAVENVNDLYVQKHFVSDHCNVCNAIDDLLIIRGCWLVSTTHRCGNYTEELNPTITYSYRGSDYETDLDALMRGDLDHMEIK